MSDVKATRAAQLTDEDRQVARAWALWVQGEICETLEERGIWNVEDEGFDEVLIEVLNDIATANASRGKENGDG